MKTGTLAGKRRHVRSRPTRPRRDLWDYVVLRDLWDCVVLRKVLPEELPVSGSPYGQIQGFDLRISKLSRNAPQEGSI
jgi:hypothetical protein